jgi:hypothetical protein
MNITLLALLIVPIAWPFISKAIWKRITYQEVAISIGLTCAVIIGLYALGKHSKVTDTEVLNGMVSGKSMETVSCSHSYDCRCYKDKKGNKHCSTCYEHTHDFNWVVYSNIGFDQTISRVDRQGTKMPDRFKHVTVGEPFAIEHSYINYIKAVPESIFHEDVDPLLASAVPAYPRVYDYYKFQRVINSGVKIPLQVVQQLNTRLNNELMTLGSAKQVNIIVILTNSTSPMYKYAVEKQWLGGKKNDVVVIVGMPKYPSIDWADTLTWARSSGNEYFQVLMRDSVKSLGTFDADLFSTLVVAQIKSHFDRPHNQDFSYLESQIEPPIWALVIAWIVSVFGTLAISYSMHNSQLPSFRRHRW